MLSQSIYSLSRTDLWKKTCRRLLVLLLASFGLFHPVLAQVKSINLDLVQSKLNNGLPLPAEQEFMVVGAIPEKIELVKLTLQRADKSSASAQSYFWKSPFGYQELSYQILVADALRSNESYILEFGFYQTAGADQIREVRSLITQNLQTYLSSLSEIKNGKIKFEDSDEVILAQMELIVQKGAYYFELPNGQQFPGFSDLTRIKLRQHREIKLKDASLNAVGVGEKDDPKAVYANQYQQELMAIIAAELDQYFSPNMLVRVDEKVFSNYPTEKTANVIPINFGYGAISLSKNLPEQEFVTGPYLGVSFPLGNRKFSPIMSNLSVSGGFFMSGNMENSLGEQLSGPILSRPMYVGLGYNFFRFVRLNLGGTFINSKLPNGDNSRSFNPFFGISAEFNLWLGLGKKN